jgi:hypothetical protein
MADAINRPTQGSDRWLLRAIACRRSVSISVSVGAAPPLGSVSQSVGWSAGYSQNSLTCRDGPSVREYRDP